MRFGKGQTIFLFALGFGFMRAWALTFLGSGGVTPPLLTHISNGIFFVFCPIMIVVMLMVMAISQRLAIDILRPEIVALSAGILTVGTCLLSMGDATISILAKAVCAIGFGVFLLQWGVLSARISASNLMLALSLGLVAAALICFALCFLPVFAASIFFALFAPLSSLGLLACDLREKQTSESPEESGAHSKDSASRKGKAFGTLFRLFVAMLIMELVARSALMLSGEYFTKVLLYPSSSFELARLVGTVFASMLFIVVAKCLKEPLRMLYMIVPISLVASCLFLLFDNWGIPFVTYAIAFSAGAWLETVFWIFFSHSHRQMKLPIITVWGVGRIAFWLSTLISLAFWSYQTYIFPEGIVSDSIATTTLTLVMALLSMVVYLFVLPEKITKSFGIAREKTVENEFPPKTYWSIDQIAMRIAEEFNLSKRETEVFLLLAKGRDTTYIQKNLFISSGTVCSHRNRIYHKLDVHSKQELLNLIENRLAQIESDK